MRGVLLRMAVAAALVAAGWAVGQAQTRTGDFELALDGPEGTTKVACLRGCSLIGGRDVGNPRAARISAYWVSCNGTARCTATVHGFIER